MNEYTLITGASSGIGKAFAKAFAKRGKNIIITARSKDALNDLAEQLRENFSVKVEVIVLDLSIEHAAKDLYNEVKKRELIVETLINNAGFATTGLLHKTDYNSQHSEIMLNVSAMTELTYLFIESMSLRNSGTIINLGSCVSFTAFPYSAVYAATKAYILSFTESVSYEYRDRGVRLLAICPGPTQTHFFDKSGNVTDHMRTPANVVNTTIHALKHRNKVVKTDGMTSLLQSILHHFTTRNLSVKIVGKISKKAWGKNNQ